MNIGTTHFVVNDIAIWIESQKEKSNPRGLSSPTFETFVRKIV